MRMKENDKEGIGDERPKRKTASSSMELHVLGALIVI